MVGSPPDPIQRILLQKAATDGGFGIEAGEENGWLAYESLGAPARLRLSVENSSSGGRAAFAAATDHGGVTAELAARWPCAADPAPPGFTAFRAAGAEKLHALVNDIWRLARALPTAPLHAYQKQVEAELRAAQTTGATEVERMVKQRVGQDVFRASLMDYWKGACAVTGVTHARLLRASHIRPWAECDSDAERLDVFNGLLLAAHLDAAFDSGLLSFTDEGSVIINGSLCAEDCARLGIGSDLRLKRVPAQIIPRLAWHRAHVFAGGK
jgi:putative restriction endonuclease